MGIYMEGLILGAVLQYMVYASSGLWLVTGYLGVSNAAWDGPKIKTEDLLIRDRVLKMSVCISCVPRLSYRLLNCYLQGWN